MKKILIISGGHRAYTSGEGGSNSAAFIDRLTAALSPERFEFLDVNTLSIEHCIDCSHCSHVWGSCIFDDDMTHVYRLLAEADVYVFVTPVYFNAVPSRLKVLIDRLQMVYKCKVAHGMPYAEEKARRGYLVAFGGARKYADQFDGVVSTIALVLTNFGAKLERTMLYPGTDHQTFEDMPDAERDVRDLARELAD